MSLSQWESTTSLIDPTGTVRWLDLTEDYRIRARPETVLEVFDRLTAGTR